MSVQGRGARGRRRSKSDLQPVAGSLQPRHKRDVWPEAR